MQAVPHPREHGPGGRREHRGPGDGRHERQNDQEDTAHEDREDDQRDGAIGGGGTRLHGDGIGRGESSMRNVALRQPAVENETGPFEARLVLAER